MNDDLLELEERGWQALSSTDPVPFCETWLAEDAVMVVPGMVIEREMFLASVADEQPWSAHKIGHARTIRLTDDSAALIYRVTAQRADNPPFAGDLTSVYVNRDGDWKLVLHQQTPLPT